MATRIPHTASLSCRRVQILLLTLLTVLGATASAQPPGELIFHASFDADDPIPPAPVFRFTPNQPFDVIFQCRLRNAQTNQESNLNYFFDFHGNGSLVSAIPLDQGSVIRLSGNYAYQNDEIGFTAAGSYDLGGGPVPLSFAFSTEQIIPRLGLVWYFTAAGERRDGLVLGGQPVAVTLRCAAIGHRYNPDVVFRSYGCPDQITAAGTYSNAFEFDFNADLPGGAFRQRDFYATGTTTGDPTLIERAEAGIYRRVGNELYIDFSVVPGAQPIFSDFNELRARFAAGAAQLVVDPFPAGAQVCSRRN